MKTQKRPFNQLHHWIADRLSKLQQVKLSEAVQLMLCIPIIAVAFVIIICVALIAGLKMLEDLVLRRQQVTN